MQISTFMIDSETFGMPTLLVEELFRPMPVTRVPSADRRLEGITNIRGKTAVVVNMRTCLGVEPAPKGIANEMILMETDAGLVQEARELGLRAFDEPVVLRVDESSSIYNINPDEIQPAPAHVNQNFVEGVARAGDRYITVISITKLINEILNSQTEA
jgi:purine-binding chemotaxis protein CheW